jgi:rod shape-determining protein MreC
LAYQDGKEGLIGRVIEVDSHTASVLLLTDQNSAIAVKIANADYKGVLYGQNSLYCRLAYIPFDADIKDDDLVVTSGDGGIIPKSLPIGMVKRIEKRGKGLFMEIKVLPFINLSKLENVLVIK